MRMSDLTSQNAYIATASCPHCETAGDFELPMAEGQFDIACHGCGELYEIDAVEAIEMAALRQMPESDIELDIEPETALHEDADLAIDAANDDEALVTIVKDTVTCMECGNQFDLPEIAEEGMEETISCPHCASDAPADDEAAFRRAPISVKEPKTGRVSIILVSIISLALVTSASVITLGLYFLTLSSDSETARYIETNILQVKPASFTVDSAAYEVSETELGTSLLVTIQITNNGGTEGTPDSMQVVLTDKNDKALVSWPLDVTGQIITAGQTIQLYTRLFEPPESFANLKVYLR